LPAHTRVGYGHPSVWDKQGTEIRARVVIIVMRRLVIVELIPSCRRFRRAQTAMWRSHYALTSRWWQWAFSRTKGATLIGLLTMVALSDAPALAAEETGQVRDTQGEARRVVILNSTDPYLPAFLALDGAQREAIRAGSREPVEFYAEALDMHRFPRKLLDQDVVDLLREKYQDLKVDVVVAVAPIALDFAQRHRAQLWPGAAIAFNSVSATLLKERRLEPFTIGLPVRLELEQTLDLALRLRPKTRRIAVVAGAEAPCCGRPALAQVLERYEERFDVQ
jgi:hypothetical protein